MSADGITRDDVKGLVAKLNQLENEIEELRTTQNELELRLERVENDE